MLHAPPCPHAHPAVQPIHAHGATAAAAIVTAVHPALIAWQRKEEWTVRPVRLAAWGETSSPLSFNQIIFLLV